MRVITGGALLFCLAGTCFAASIAGSRVSTDRLTPFLEERSGQGLRAANRAYRSAKNAWRDGDRAAMLASIERIEQGVELAYQALAATGTSPRARPESFKRAEISLARLLRRLQFFEIQVSYDDRAAFQSVANEVERLHDDLLMSLTSGTPLSAFLLGTG